MQQPRDCAAGRSLADQVEQQFQRLAVKNKILAEYVWLGGSGSDLRSKTKVISFRPASAEELPVWHYDGSSTGQAGERCSSVFLKPRAIYPDPFRQGDHILVLCDTFDALLHSGAGMQPHPSNNRVPCEKVMAAAAASEPVFTVEQQYTLLHAATLWPLGWPERASNDASSYCGVGPRTTYGRDFAEYHLRACLHAGLAVCSAYAENVAGQWSYSVGPCAGMEASDQLWMSRYLLSRCAERLGIVASLEPKPVPGDWGGSGAFVRYSTAETREPEQGWDAIQRHMLFLSASHLSHTQVCGCGNSARLTGMHKTSSPHVFSYGVEDRSASVRIPYAAALNRRGWYEDRRPASNMDPYLVTTMLACSTLSIPLPFAMEQQDESAGEIQKSHSSFGSRSAGAGGFSEMLGPDTPPQNIPLLLSASNSPYRM